LSSITYPLEEVMCGVPEAAGHYVDLEVDVPQEVEERSRLTR